MKLLGEIPADSDTKPPSTIPTDLAVKAPSATPTDFAVKPPIAILTGCQRPAEDSLATASRILDVIYRYRMPSAADAANRADEGFLKFLAIVYAFVKSGRPVGMCLLAFLFKSPSRDVKVFSRSPDKGEELALANLNGLCKAIADIYPPGAKLVIISNGLVYNGNSSLRALV
jgi:hypothetical protein